MTASDRMEVTFPVTEEAECHCGGMLVTLFGLASVWDPLPSGSSGDTELSSAIEVEHTNGSWFSLFS